MREVGAVRATLSGLCASLVGIGLARFAYTPLMPVMIRADWFTASVVVYLGAANSRDISSARCSGGPSRPALPRRSCFAP